MPAYNIRVNKSIEPLVKAITMFRVVLAHRGAISQHFRWLIYVYINNFLPNLPWFEAPIPLKGLFLMTTTFQLLCI